MYFSLAFILGSLNFLTAAIPLVQSPASGGIPIPITKRAGPLNAVVDISQLQSGMRRSIANIQRGFAVYERNTGVAHPLSGGIKHFRRATGSDPLTDDSSKLWYGSISVGTPAVSFTVDFDTGSSDIFLPGPSCGTNCSGHKVYDPDASSTSKDLLETFKLTYADGSSVTGEQYTDVVSIAGLTAKVQTLGAAAEYSLGFGTNLFPPDGLLGLAFQSISKYNASPPFQTLISEGVLTSPVFGTKLATSGSELYLGGTNSALYTGDFTWVSLTTVGYWQASFESISVNGEVVVGSTAAIFDTGTTTIIGDATGIATFFAAIDGAQAAPQIGAGIYTIPCTFNTPISITLGGRAFSISPASIIRGPISEGSSTCVAGVIFDPTLNSEFWILGDVFLQNVYTAWDVGNSRIGFATLA